MKFIHTGDLHIGKTVNNFNMLSDQKAILHEMVEIARQNEADAFIIAGDVYDRAIPTAEAVTVMNDFLDELMELNIPVFIISGNHDSPQRLEFAERILDKQEVYIAGTFCEKLKQITLKDSYGDVVITMMPFVKSAELSVSTSMEAVILMLKTTRNNMRNRNARNILVTHYFVTNAGISPELSDSETGVLVGGLDNVDCSVFEDFDYVALGHIHKPQLMNQGEGMTVNYAGSPLAYSFSECNQEKSVTLVEVKEKGNVTMNRISLHPVHNMRKIKGKLEKLIAADATGFPNTTDYIQATLTDEEELIDPVGVLRNVYPNLMQLLFEKNLQENTESIRVLNDISTKTTEELFADFYKAIRDKEIDEQRRQIVRQILKEIEKD